MFGSYITFSFALVCSLGMANAQTYIDLSKQGKNIDFTLAPTTAPVKTVSALPNACSVGHIVLVTTAPVGANLFACVATNVWTPQGNTLPPGTQNGDALTWNSSSAEWQPRTVSPVANGGTGTTTSTGTGSVVLSGSPTIVTPTIASFANASHNHANPAGGGQITDAALSAAVSVAKGGTGATTLTGVLLGNGASAVTGSSAVPVCTKYTVPYPSVQTAATATDVTLFTLPARGKVTGLTIKHSAAFSGTGITGVTVSVGRSGNAIAYADAYDILQAVNDTAMQDDGGHYSATFVSHAVTARFSSTGANLSALTTGSLDIWACTVTLP